MKQLTNLLNDDWGSPKKGTYPSPCQIIENLSYEYSEKTGIDSNPDDSRFMVLVNFPNRKYREITHVQEYDIESMVGNIGGYIGLFLGYSLLHFPKFLLNLWKAKRNKGSAQTNVIKPILKPTKIQEINHLNRSSFKTNRCTSCLQLEDVNKHIFAITRKMKDLELSVREIREDLRSSKDVSYDKSVKKVKVTAWNNAVYKATSTSV